ncbi:MAG TPA: hypothetical protein DCX07_15365, partial [Phycisphaerales bacterium]|nr:hypothetical protein [Phycisphaerales bacterium]
MAGDVLHQAPIGAVGAESDADGHSAGAAGDFGRQRVGPGPRGGRKENRPVVLAPQHLADRRVGDPVDLVHRQQHARAVATEFVQHAVDRLDLLLDALVRGVGHVDQQVGADGLFQRGAEAGDEVMRQGAHEAE